MTTPEVEFEVELLLDVVVLVDAVLVPEVLLLMAAFPVEALDVVLPVELDVVDEVDATADASDAGRPVEAAVVVTGPALVAIMSGA